MFPFAELKQIHLEITNNCQASCPMCSRNVHGGIDNPWLKIKNWSLKDYETIITPEVINQVDSIYFCGNYGDPLMNKDLLEMVHYTVEIKPTIQIRIHTNGSIQNTAWWAKLAHTLPKNHSVIWGIDGLEDTNHIYRIGTVFSKIMNNAKAFIDAGGISEWAFIVFKHNEHQLVEAEHKAYEMGFKYFTHKNSNRFMMEPKFPVYDTLGDSMYDLEPATESKIVFIDKKTIENYKSIVNNSTINCMAVENKEVYIDAFGHVYPCCFIGLVPYNYYDVNSSVSHIMNEIAVQHFQLMTSLNGPLDCKQRSLRSIINSVEYQTVWNKYWTDTKLITCARTCGVNHLSKSKDQFISREAL